MFKCIDCEKTYKEKPDYCECGNNVFEEIAVLSSAQKNKKNLSLQYPRLKKIIDSCDIFSLIIFSLCILLSVYILIFFQPVSQLNNINKDKNSAPISTPMPSIDNICIKTVKKNDENKNQNVVNQNTTPSPLQQKKKTQVISNIIKNKPQKEEKLVVSRTHKEKNKEEKLVSEPKELQIIDKKKQEIQEKENIEKKKQAEDWNNYKVSLRQALFNNLAVTSVVGSGECVVEFAIQKTDGKLIDRSFIQQSPNETVNQVVYNMMMKLPYYYTPPEYYNGEKIKMKFLFNNGSYEISYIN